ncbi:hypothetical protein [Arthrobacter sp. VKM Ac-2550]|uniref:hypothetical protein n=1 Tax=Crystallibacter permensis TaxID=1938888 RepID=UPI002227E2DE|nr:hypothetical protein [Arthrobacter sp. VKM Ac-2550]MCW2134100.1 hypothetical protein [Arthrobacter sp. VKM Ac-2550]
MARASTGPSGTPNKQVRLVPVLVAAGLTMVLALVAHLASGGTMPALPVLGAITALTTLTATVLSRVQAPQWVLIVSAGAAQQVLHLAFEACAARPATGASAASSAGGPHSHHTEVDPAQLAATASVATEQAGPHGEYVMLMLHFHLAAAVLTALLLSWSRFSGPAATATLPQRP